MSKKPKDIRLGLLYLGRGEYSKVIRLLEPKIPLFLENREFYSILGRAFYYTGDFAGAKLYFDRGQKVHWEIERSLYLAVLALKRRDYNSALRIWLDILDEDPNNKMAKKGLVTLKKYSTMDNLENFIHSKKINLLVPRRTIIPTKSTTVLSIILLLLAVFSVGFIKLDLLRFVQSRIKHVEMGLDSTERDGVNVFDLESFESDYIDFSNQSVYSFSGSQIEDFFNIASGLFQDQKDNKVRSYLNLIKYSNANSNIKKRAELLNGYLVDPDWASYSDDISFKDVENNYYQYESCIVKWKGRLSNLEILNKKIHFSFLVGYDDGKVLEGVVPVELNENVKIQENQPIEVLGRIILRDNTFYVEALTVMQYVIKEK